MFSTYHLESFGEQLREIRKLNKLTQVNVQNATGINVDTIRRIENGTVIPKYETLELLSTVYKVDILQVLYTFRIDKQVSELYSLLDIAIINGEVDRIKQMCIINERLKELDSRRLINKNEFEQLGIFTSTTAHFHDSQNIESDILISKLSDSLNLTILHFDISRFEDFIYSTFEIRILLLIGLLYKKEQRIELSNEILIFCLDYISKKDSDDSTEAQMLRIKLYYNISYNYYKLENDNLALDFADQGISFCMARGSYYCLALLFARKATAQLYLGVSDYMYTYKKAISLLYIIDDVEHAEYMRKKTFELHKVDIDTLDLSLR